MAWQLFNEAGTPSHDYCESTATSTLKDNVADDVSDIYRMWQLNQLPGLPA